MTGVGVATGGGQKVRINAAAVHTLADNAEWMDKKENDVLIRTMFVSTAQARMNVAQAFMAGAISAFIGLAIALVKEAVALGTTGIFAAVALLAIGGELAWFARYYVMLAYETLATIPQAIIMYYIRQRTKRAARATPVEPTTQEASPSP